MSEQAEETKVKPEKVFADGIQEVFQPIFRNYDLRMKDIQFSQTELSDRIYKLNNVLLKCQKEAEYVNVKPYLMKLTSCKKNIQLISSTLLKISDRLNKLNKLAKMKYPELFIQYNHEKKEEERRKKEEEKKKKEEEKRNREEEKKESEKKEVKMTEFLKVKTKPIPENNEIENEDEVKKNEEKEENIQNIKKESIENENIESQDNQEQIESELEKKQEKEEINDLFEKMSKKIEEKEDNE